MFSLPTNIKQAERFCDERDLKMEYTSNKDLEQRCKTNFKRKNFRSKNLDGKYLDEII